MLFARQKETLVLLFCLPQVIIICFYFQDIGQLCFVIVLYFIIVISILLLFYLLSYYFIFIVVFYYFILFYFACKIERHSSCLPLVHICSALFNFNVISFI